ncbi:gas vesicle protein [Nocardioides guangzhouensis]|uniref:Gas vesicle protein A n=1 Tax=Nocardioides guangzhouensis TaxID=2497878 RepID=A0A4Q4ZD14_9ACTN|nr:gas vesicle protein GvpJ [Nocardioides guangzhouensis]RYP85882.1 gas vesicle protein [Nocardioides guangzhouensis]
MREQGSGYLARPAPSGLADVVETILDKGIVVDAYARVSLLGIEVLTLDARVVVASVDTYLRFAEATNRLDLDELGGESPVELLTEGAGKVIEGVASNVAERKVEGVVEKAGDVVEGVAGTLADKGEELVHQALGDDPTR